MVRCLWKMPRVPGGRLAHEQLGGIHSADVDVRDAEGGMGLEAETDDGNDHEEDVDQGDYLETSSFWPSGYREHYGTPTARPLPPPPLLDCLHNNQHSRVSVN